MKTSIIIFFLFFSNLCFGNTFGKTRNWYWGFGTGISQIDGEISGDDFNATGSVIKFRIGIIPIPVLFFGFESSFLIGKLNLEKRLLINYDNCLSFSFYPIIYPGPFLKFAAGIGGLNVDYVSTNKADIAKLGVGWDISATKNLFITPMLELICVNCMGSESYISQERGSTFNTEFSINFNWY